jgi:hypothetical protein
MQKIIVFHLNIHFTAPLTLPPGAAAPVPLSPTPKLRPFLYVREDNVRVLDTDYHRQRAMLNRNAVMVTNIHKILVSFRAC